MATFKNGLTAVAGGGQSASATIGVISGNGDPVNNRFTTVATTGDSATLPQAAGGLEYRVFNAGANSMNVFPLLGDAINLLGANTALAIPSGKGALFFSCAPLFWNAILSA